MRWDMKRAWQLRGTDALCPWAGSSPAGRDEEFFGAMGTFSKRVVPCLSYAASSIYMTIAQKYVVINAPEVKALFLFYQNLAALVLYVPSNLGWLARFHIQVSLLSPLS